MSPVRASLLLLLAAFLWGCSNVAQKGILDHIGPFTSVGLRCLIGGLVIAPFLFRERRGATRIPRHLLPHLIGITASYGAALLFYQASFGGTTVTNAGFFVNVCSVVTPLIAWLFLRSAPSPLVIPAVIFSLGGIFLMGGAKLDGLNWGDGLALLAAVSYAVWAVLISHFLQQVPRPITLLVVSMFSCGAISLLIGLAIEPLTVATLQVALPELLFLGIVGTGIGYGLQMIVQQYLCATVAMIIVSAEAVFGAMLAQVLLGETLDFIGYLGAASVVIGIVIVALPTKAYAHIKRQIGVALGQKRLRPIIVFEHETLSRPREISIAGQGVGRAGKSFRHRNPLHKSPSSPCVTCRRQRRFHHGQIIFRIYEIPPRFHTGLTLL